MKQIQTDLFLNVRIEIKKMCCTSDKTATQIRQFFSQHEY